MFIRAGGPGTVRHSDPVGSIGSNAPGPYAHHQMEGPSPPAAVASVAKFPVDRWIPNPSGEPAHLSRTAWDLSRPKCTCGPWHRNDIGATVLRLLPRLMLLLLLLLLLATLVPPASSLPPSPTCTGTASASRLSTAGVQGMGVHRPLHRHCFAKNLLFDLVIQVHVVDYLITASGGCLSGRGWTCLGSYIKMRDSL